MTLIRIGFQTINLDHVVHIVWNVTDRLVTSCTIYLDTVHSMDEVDIVHLTGQEALGFYRKVNYLTYRKDKK